MRFRTVILLLFLCFGLFGSIGGGFYGYINMNELLTEQVFYHLETTVQARAHHIEIYLENKNYD